MPSKKNMMKKNLENLHLKERINYGYRKVIIMMLVSGLFSIVVIGMLFANTMHYVQNVTVADRAVKICRINVNSSARNIREMALNKKRRRTSASQTTHQQHKTQKLWRDCTDSC